MHYSHQNEIENVDVKLKKHLQREEHNHHLKHLLPLLISLMIENFKKVKK